MVHRLQNTERWICMYMHTIVKYAKQSNFQFVNICCSNHFCVAHIHSYFIKRILWQTLKHFGRKVLRVFSRTKHCVKSENSQLNSPGEILHTGERLALLHPISEISEITDTYIHRHVHSQRMHVLL